MKKTALFVAMILSTAAMADGPGYNYLQGSYTQLETDDVFSDFGLNEPKMTGTGFAASYGLNDNWFIAAGFNSIDDDYYNAKLENDNKNIGVGYRLPVSATTDLVFSVDYLKVDFTVSADGDHDSFNDDGRAYGMGIRSMVAENFELSAAYSRVEMDEGEGSNNITVSGQYYVSKNWSLGLAYTDGENTTANTVFARYNF